MATITDRSIVDKIIEGDGVYPGDEDYPVVKITEYRNAFNGGIAYGLQYKDDPDNKYQASPYVLQPEVIW